MDLSRYEECESDTEDVSVFPSTVMYDCVQPIRVEKRVYEATTDIGKENVYVLLQLIIFDLQV